MRVTKPGVAGFGPKGLNVSICAVYLNVNKDCIVLCFHIVECIPYGFSHGKLLQFIVIIVHNMIIYS